MKVDNMDIYVAGGIGGFIVGLADLLKNENTSTVLRLTRIIQTYIFSNSNYQSGGAIFTLLFLAILGVTLCWVNNPLSKHDAFSRGFSVFALLAVISPEIPPSKNNSMDFSLSEKFEKSSSQLDTQSNADIWLNSFISVAKAEETNLREVQFIDSGEVYIYLTGLNGDIPLNSSIIIRDSKDINSYSYDIVDSQFITIKKPVGNYIIELNIPGYKRVQAYFDITKDNLISVYSLKLSSSKLPLGFQMLFDIEEEKLNFLQMETFRQIGISFAKKKDFDKAIENYNKALELNSNDYKTYNFKAYSLYRKRGDFLNQALLSVNKSLSINDDSIFAKLNKIKILCALEKNNDAVLFLTADKNLQDIIKKDGEALRECKGKI